MVLITHWPKIGCAFYNVVETTFLGLENGKFDLNCFRKWNTFSVTEACIQLEMHVCTNVTVQKWDLILGSVPKEGL